MKELNESLSYIIQTMPDVPEDVEYNIGELYNAWVQRDDETLDDYMMFQLFLEVPDYINDPMKVAEYIIDISNYKEFSTSDIVRAYNAHEWPLRKVAFRSFKVYLNIQKAKINDMKTLENFKGANLTIAESALSLTMSLCEKIQEVIEGIDLSLIDAKDLSSLIRALSTLGTFANDMATMAVALDDIVEHLDSQIV